MSLAKRWNCFWFGPEDPLNLGICRALMYGFLFFFYLKTDFSQYAQLGPKSAFWTPIWLFKSMHFPALPAHEIFALEIVWKISLLMACVGLLTRWAAPVAFILALYLIGLTLNYGKVEHMTMPMMVTVAIMAFARSGDAFSIDGWIARRKGKPPAPASGEYRWPVRMVWLIMSISFFAAGVAKLRYTGIQWALGDGFRTLMIKQHYQPNPPFVHWGLYVAQYKWLSRLFAGGSLMTELLFPLAMFDRRARWFFPLSAFGMQLGIGLIMNVWFLLFIPVYVFWIPWGCLFASRRQPVDLDPAVKPPLQSTYSQVTSSP